VKSATMEHSLHCGREVIEAGLSEIIFEKLKGTFMNFTFCYADAEARKKTND